MSGTAILSIAKSSTDGIYSVIVWVPNPADPNPKSPTAWIPEGPIALEVPEGEQATPGLCFDGTNNVLLMTLWGEDYPYFAAMVSSHLDLISIDKLPMKKSDNVVTEALAIVSVDGRTIIKAVQSGSDVNENTYWIHQSKGSGWSEITLIPSTGLPTDSQALSGELVCPISMFPSFSYVHYLSYRYSLVANTSGFYLDSFQLQYLPTSPSTNLYCTRTQIQLPSGVTITLDQGSPPVQYLVTSKTICNTEIYLLYIFWAQDSFSPISYCYIELGSDGSVNTSADTIQAQGYGTIGSSVPRDGILFNVVQGMGRVFCFWVVNSSLAGMSCSIGSDGTMQGDWEWVQSSIAGPACKGAFSCVSVPQPWLKLPPSELAKDE